VRQRDIISDKLQDRWLQHQNEVQASAQGNMSKYEDRFYFIHKYKNLKYPVSCAALQSFGMSMLQQFPLYSVQLPKFLR
jgi:hypothetical protein